ncbi:uncharacterized protein LOC117315210 [Pecten maximus]|uniref:uncharacterized protein LOC117315210 n=1 Tax=Pecten maximus TaxID=6579 RepID=UPI001458A034|nr:uncharacterized protein LOC117315210 [Pecten maximus]
MAASMDTTPVKIVLPNTTCMLCLQENRRAHCLVKAKATKENYLHLLQTFTGVTIEKDLLWKCYVCTSCLNEEFITERLQCDILPAIDESFKDVAQLGRSVLFIKDCKDLCEKDWFRDIAADVHDKCPELFQVLFTALGNKITAESKMGTISIIYGMIMHSRNVKACAVQRILTSLCIRYHADNLVTF